MLCETAAVHLYHSILAPHDCKTESGLSFVCLEEGPACRLKYFGVHALLVFFTVIWSTNQMDSNSNINVFDALNTENMWLLVCGHV